MFRRKTRAAREQERIEKAEFVRRVRTGESDVRPADPDVTHAIAGYNRALHAAADASQLPEPSLVEEEAVCCELHGWRPALRVSWQPLPPPSSCPKCARGTGHLERPPQKRDQYEVSPPGLLCEEDAPPLLAWLWRKKVDELRRNGLVLPGSDEERHLIERMDEAREVAMQNDRGDRPGRGGAQRIENGCAVVWRPTKRRRPRHMMEA
jgi:hypothetical protein